MPRYVFLDIETSGLPLMIGFNKYHDYKRLDMYASSRVIQLALSIYDDSKLVETHNVIIKPLGYEIKNSEFHSITHEHALVYGVNMFELRDILSKAFEKNNILVAHNVLFDKNVLLSDLYRNNLDDVCVLLDQIAVYCTCTNSINITKIPFSAYSYKLPKLSELYAFLFHSQPTNQHDALGDVETLVKIFFELQKRGLLLANV